MSLSINEVAEQTTKMLKDHFKRLFGADVQLEEHIKSRDFERDNERKFKRVSLEFLLIRNARHRYIVNVDIKNNSVEISPLSRIKK